MREQEPPGRAPLVRAVAAAAALAVAAFSYGTTESLPVGLLQLIAVDLETSKSAVGLLVTGYGITVAVASVPLAKATTAIPRRYVLSGLLAAFVASTLVSAAATAYWVLLAARVVTALSQALFWPVAVVAAAGLFAPRVRGRAATVVFTGGSLAIVLGVPAGTWIGQQSGWRASFLVLSAIGLLALVMVVALLPTTAPQDSHAARGSDPDPRRFRLLVLTVALSVGGVFTPYTYLTEFLLRVSGFAAESISPLLLLNGVFDIVGLACAAALVDRGPRALIGGSAAVLMSALLVLFAIGRFQVATAAGVALLGFALPGLAAAMQARTLQVAPGNTDVASAWISAAFNVGIAGGALAGSVLLPLAGVRWTALAGAALLGGALAVVALEGGTGGRSARRRGRGAQARQKVR